MDGGPHHPAPALATAAPWIPLTLPRTPFPPRALVSGAEAAGPAPPFFCAESWGQSCSPLLPPAAAPLLLPWGLGTPWSWGCPRGPVLPWQPHFPWL